MNLLFIGYWGVNEGLTSATILPHLRILSRSDRVQKIVFCSVERSRENVVPSELGIPKVRHVPLVSDNLRIPVLNKVADFRKFHKQLLQIVREEQIDTIVSRSATAGAMGYLLHQATGLPFYVESFEPHARYMLESGVWGRWNPKYLFERYWEEKQKRHAKGLMPVSENYRQQLISEGVAPEKIRTMPCCVPMEPFEFQPDLRAQVRRELGIDPANRSVGIYVGKFGAIYYDEEAFSIFGQASKFFGEDFFLILLTPHPKAEVEEKLSRSGVPLARTFVGLVPHEAVPGYLAAADFAFSTIRPAPSRKYCSAIKHGEYWANGLPLLVTENAGDDSRIIEESGLGAILDLDPEKMRQAFEKMKGLLQAHTRESLAAEVVELAHIHRDFSVVSQAYRDLLGT